MSLLEMVVKEFISIVEAVEQNSPAENNRIILERDYFKALLERYAYMTFKEKTSIYKALNFIIHDKNNYTMPYKDVARKKTVRKVIINYNTYAIVKNLIETSV